MVVALVLSGLGSVWALEEADTETKAKSVSWEQLLGKVREGREQGRRGCREQSRREHGQEEAQTGVQVRGSHGQTLESPRAPLGKKSCTGQGGPFASSPARLRHVPGAA